MTNQRVALLTNPDSTLNRRNMKRMRRTVAAGANILHLELAGIESMDEALRQIARYDPVVMIISGGDGTVQAALTSLKRENPFKTMPPIAVLPSGKTNLVAADLGMKGRPDGLFRDVIAVARGNRFKKALVERPILKLELERGGAAQYGLFFGAAGVVNAIQFCRSRLFPLHLPNPLLHLVGLFAIAYSTVVTGRRKGAMAYAGKAAINALGGGRMEGHFVIVVATTLDRLFLGVKPSDWAGKGGIGLAVVEHDRGAILRTLRGVFLGRVGTTTIAGLHVRRINEVRITGRDMVLLDGEIFSPPEGRPLSLEAVAPMTFVSLRGYK